MRNPLIMKSERGAALTDEDRSKLNRVTATSRLVESHQDIISEGDRPNAVHLVMSGFAYRYKTLETGARQIMAFLVPGDFCDLQVAILGEMDHNIGTLSRCMVVDIPHSTVEELTFHHPRIARAFWWATLVDEGILREWLVNMGQRPADRQVAHLFCELHLRLKTVGLVDDDSYELPVTQQELGETLGLSTVHVNRTLQHLRGQGLLSLRSKTLQILDLPRLMTYAGFNPNYLHLKEDLPH